MRHALSATLDYLWPVAGGLAVWGYALTPGAQRLLEWLRPD